ncbi:hypothetical protein [Dyella sp.]|jgi:hypothetical protein|uniref:hypothetical protein n=1 Tax=Dyella sp. TaxID=1869338 RepID=UPI002D78DE0E|nr:hypothetical protein [Dyella sp.]HET6431694.1 hypothetical protein [Dyella sp.]
MDTKLPREISRPTASHCAALFYGTLSNLIWKGSDNFIEGQGTLTFLRYKGHLFGVTNEHVVKKAIDAYEDKTDQYVFLVALQKHEQIRAMPIARFTQDDPHVPFDLAIFRLPECFLDGSDKTPINLNQSTPILLAPGSKGLAVGFPGSHRKVVSPQTMSHRLFHVVATCHGISDRKIILQDAFDQPGPEHRFGGMSGGPVFALTGDHNYEFQGILFEGRGFGDVGPDDLPGTENWIWAFPFSGELLERACEGSGLEF